MYLRDLLWKVESWKKNSITLTVKIRFCLIVAISDFSHIVAIHQDSGCVQLKKSHCRVLMVQRNNIWLSHVLKKGLYILSTAFLMLIWSHQFISICSPKWAFVTNGFPDERYKNTTSSTKNYSKNGAVCMQSSRFLLKEVGERRPLKPRYPSNSGDQKLSLNEYLIQSGLVQRFFLSVFKWPSICFTYGIFLAQVVEWKERQSISSPKFHCVYMAMWFARKQEYPWYDRRI